MKILYIATIGGFMPFFKELVRKLIDEGHTVDFAANQSSSKVPDYYSEWGCKIFNISCSRSPLSFGNIKAIKEIKNLAQNYDVVHCHTPIAGLVTRIGCKKLRKNKKIKVIYTAHGFHFYKGAPKKNWIIYYPIEKVCSKWTDVLITINKEDYEFAKSKMKTKKIFYIPGVGIDIKKFDSTVVNKEEKRKKLGIPQNAYLVLSVGELNANKNHETIIKAIAKLNDCTIHYMIAGKGDKEEELKMLAEKNGVNLHLIGYRNDVAELYKISDLYVHPSFREGLPVSVMEAIASKIPIICSDIRGCSDLISNTNRFKPTDILSIASMIQKRPSLEFLMDKSEFSSDTIIPKMMDIYNLK